MEEGGGHLLSKLCFSHLALEVERFGPDENGPETVLGLDQDVLGLLVVGKNWEA